MRYVKTFDAYHHVRDALGVGVGTTLVVAAFLLLSWLGAPRTALRIAVLSGVVAGVVCWANGARLRRRARAVARRYGPSPRAR